MLYLYFTNFLSDAVIELYDNKHKGPLLLKLIDFHPNTDKQSHPV